MAEQIQLHLQEALRLLDAAQLALPAAHVSTALSVMRDFDEASAAEAVVLPLASDGVLAASLGSGNQG